MNASLFLLYGLLNVVLCQYQEDACAAFGGQCQLSNTRCPGPYLSGKCPTQPWNVKCCTSIQEARCTRAGGKCQFSVNPCVGGSYTSGDCPTQPSAVKCCVKDQITSTRRCYSSANSRNGGRIASEADSHIDSTTWSFVSDHRVGANENKCNIFVAEIIENAGGSVPGFAASYISYDSMGTYFRHWYIWSPIGAREWLNPRSTFLTRDKCWSLVTGCVQKGDVVAHDGHVGIVTGDGLSTSAGGERVVKSAFGFRPVETPVFWRYVC